MSDLLERDDGTLCLRTRNDPSIERAIGYRRFWLAADIGFQDPTGMILLRDEQVPFWDKTRQKLGPRLRTIVWADMFREVSYASICTYLQQLLARPSIRGRVKLAIDGSGIGAPFSSFLADQQIDHLSVSITAGAAISKHGRQHNVSKSILIGDLANALETRKLLIAADLPLRDRIMRELEAFEVRVTAAGNQVLNIARSEDVGHGDLAIAAALAFYHSSNLPGYTGQAKLEGYW